VKARASVEDSDRIADLLDAVSIPSMSNSIKVSFANTI
jgi:hypothetical protein